VNSLPKTVTRQRRDCDLNPGPSAPESSTLTTRLPSHHTNRVLTQNDLPEAARGSAEESRDIYDCLVTFRDEKRRRGGNFSPVARYRRLTRSTISRITIPRPVDPLSARFSSRTDRGHAAGFSVHTCDRRRRSRPTGPARRVSSNFGHRGTKCVWSPPTFQTRGLRLWSRISSLIGSVPRPPGKGRGTCTYV